MNTQYIILLKAIIILTSPSSCRTASWSDPLIAPSSSYCLNSSKNTTKDELPGKKRGHLERFPNEIMQKEIIERLESSALINLAIAFPDLYPMIKEASLFIRLKKHIEWHNGGDLQAAFFDIVRCHSSPKTNDIIDYLVQRINIEQRDKIWGCTPLPLAVNKGYRNVVTQLLRNRANINTRTGSSMSLMVVAVLGHDPEIMQTLIAHGAKINELDEYGNSALSYGIFWDRPQMVKILIDHGADCSTLSQLDKEKLKKLDFHVE